MLELLNTVVINSAQTPRGFVQLLECPKGHYELHLYDEDITRVVRSLCISKEDGKMIADYSKQYQLRRSSFIDWIEIQFGDKP